jgi:competence protein ComEC
MAPLDGLAAARGRLFPFVPVCIGLGIGLGFAAPPGGPGLLAAAAVLILAAAAYLRGPEALQPLAAAAAAAAAGVLAVGLRIAAVAAPVLAAPYAGPVEGRVVAIDRSASDALRLTLDRVVLADLPAAATPARVRVSLLSAAAEVPEPGATVILTARLSPPAGPVEPGGFDFARTAFFDRLGAVGHTRTPVLVWAPPEPGTQAINRLRLWLADGIRAAVPGDAGAFAAGVMTGDRSGLSQAAVAALRDSNLAHLLAISGMNLAFLTGFVFALIRYGIALVPRLALRLNAKKIAAAVALAVAFFYLRLSGSNVATERAFIMAAVMLAAILLDRRALTMRSVAIAAVVILLWQPESLAEPGFQMSFAATVALIAGFAALQGRVERARAPGWALWVYTLVLSSVIGGFATAPFAAATFNRFADFGLVANLLTVPVMGVGVIGAGAVAALLAPVGLAGPALWLMGMAARWILFVAGWIAGLEGSVTAIPAPPAWAIPALALGALWLVLWPGRARLAGLAPCAAALLLWPTAPRPQLLVSEDGRLAGLLGPAGRALSAPRGAGFAAEAWLQRDGDLASQAEAAARPGFAGPPGARTFTLGGLSGVIVTGRGAAARAAAACASADLVIVAAAADGGGRCRLIDRRVLAGTGALALSAEGGSLVVRAARSGVRPWDRPAAPAAAAPAVAAPAVAASARLAAAPR